MVQRATLLVALEQVPEDVRTRWSSAFAAFDFKGTGLIDAEELTAVMQSMKMIPHRGEVEAMIAAVDLNGDHVVSYDEFELMMVSAGRAKGSGVNVGFSHVVDRHIRIADVTNLITCECTAMVDRFCREHVEEYLDLPHPDERVSEHKPAWFDTFKVFTEEAELTLQNVLLLWGVASQKNFDDEFLEAAQESNLVDDFLKLTEYEPFLDRMRAYVKQHQLGTPLLGSGAPPLPRPVTPHTRARTQQRLAELDQELAELDSRRNKLLAERRRIVGCEITPVTTTCLKQEFEARRWRDEVGFD